MARSLLFVLMLLTGAVSSGCAVHEAHKDHDLIRSTLLDLYTDQVMDNLVRTERRMPIIQLEYTQAQAQVSITTTIGGSDSQASTSSNVLAIPAASLAATRSIVTTLLGNATNANSNQVSIAAEPVTDYDAIYNYYLDYIRIPGALLVSDAKPSPEIAHISKKVGKKYYYVPYEHRDDFFRLALDTITKTDDPARSQNEKDVQDGNRRIQMQLQNLNNNIIRTSQ